MIDIIVSHPLLPVLTVATLVIIVWLSRFGDDLGVKWYVLALASIPMMTIGFLSCLGLAGIENLISPSHQSNIRMFGYILEFPFLAILFSKIIKADFKVTWDVFSFTYSISMIFGRIPCYIHGCCVGRAIPGTELRWPIRETEMLICLVYSLYIVFRLLKRKRKYTGRLIPIFMIIYGGYRFFAEFIREPDNYYFGIFDLAQVWAILSIVLGIVFLLYLRNKEPIIIDSKSKPVRRK